LGVVRHNWHLTIKEAAMKTARLFMDLAVACLE
jgi:hypothetical protein